MFASSLIQMTFVQTHRIFFRYAMTYRKQIGLVRFRDMHIMHTNRIFAQKSKIFSILNFSLVQETIQDIEIS